MDEQITRTEVSARAAAFMFGRQLGKSTFALKQWKRDPEHAIVGLYRSRRHRDRLPRGEERRMMAQARSLRLD